MPIPINREGQGFARSVRRREVIRTLWTILRPIISLGSLFPVACVDKFSKQEMRWQYIKENITGGINNISVAFSKVLSINVQKQKNNNKMNNIKRLTNIQENFWLKYLTELNLALFSTAVALVVIPF